MNEEEKIINYLKSEKVKLIADGYSADAEIMKNAIDLIETQKAELEKKDKIIDKMAYDLMHLDQINWRFNLFSKEQLIQNYMDLEEK